MNILQKLLKSRAEVLLSGDGKIILRGASAELIAEAKTNKLELVALLKSEAANPTYVNSKLWWDIEEMYARLCRIERAGCMVKACQRAKAYLTDLDAEACVSMAAAQTWIGANSKDVMAQIDAIVQATKEHGAASGPGLVSMILNVFPGAETSERHDASVFA